MLKCPNVIIHHLISSLKSRTIAYNCTQCLLSQWPIHTASNRYHWNQWNKIMNRMHPYNWFVSSSFLHEHKLINLIRDCPQYSLLSWFSSNMSFFLPILTFDLRFWLFDLRFWLLVSAFYSCSPIFAFGSPIMTLGINRRFLGLRLWLWAWIGRLLGLRLWPWVEIGRIKFKSEEPRSLVIAPCFFFRY